MARAPRDIERFYSTPEVVAKLRRLADALEQDTSFRIQVGGVRIRVPVRAQFSIEHELGEDEEEIEFQLKWTVDPGRGGLRGRRCRLVRRTRKPPADLGTVNGRLQLPSASRVTCRS